VELIRYRGDCQQAGVLEQWLDQVLHDYGDRVLALDSDAAQVWGRLRVPDPQHAIDKQIAAIALLHELTVVTRNVVDFANTGVRLLNPFTGG
jgi:predicted nucleic acid-binding protein